MPSGSSRRNHRVPDRLEQLLSGAIKVEDLDDEEIMRGQLRSADGSFRGRPSAVVPRAFHDAIKAELVSRSDRKLQENLTDARTTIVELMLNRRTPAMVRLMAAQHVEARLIGPIPKEIQAKVETKKWEDVDGLLVDVDVEAEAEEE